MNFRLTAARRDRAFALIATMTMVILVSSQLRADTGTCVGQTTMLPFTDVPAGNVFFCAIAQAFFTGLTNGTSATTYSPNEPVPREQMSAFVTRTLDQSLKRGSNRAALDQFWTAQSNSFALTTVGNGPRLVESDGADLWVANRDSNSVSRVRASDGRLLETWTGATSATGVLVAMGNVFVTGSPSNLYRIDPAQPFGAVSTVSAVLGNEPQGITYDGLSIWTANVGTGSPGTGSVSKTTLNPGQAPAVTNVATGFSQPIGILFDGVNIWVTDRGDNTLKKLNSNGVILLSVGVGSNPGFPAFDGTNIWVPNGTGSNTVSVVRVLDSQGHPVANPFVLGTLSGNGLNNPRVAAFDGERMLLTNSTGNNVSLWKTTDLTPIGTFSTGASTSPLGACSDGLNFWITLLVSNKLARF